jgi:hypothetical protein
MLYKTKGYGSIYGKNRTHNHKQKSPMQFQKQDEEMTEDLVSELNAVLEQSNPKPL